MSNYRIRARRHTHPRLGGQGLSPQDFAWLLPDAEVASLVEEGSFAIIELRLRRESHLEALNEILGALQRLGYSVLESTVSEWVDASVQTALTVAIAGAGSAGATTRNPKIAIAAAAAGAIAGYLAGSQIGRMKVVYTLVPTPGGWAAAPTTEGTVPALAGVQG